LGRLSVADAPRTPPRTEGPMVHLTPSTIYLSGILLFTSGCATIFHGPPQEIRVNSTPPGASVCVENHQVFLTPAAVKLHRHQRHTLLVRKPGYKDAAVVLTSGPAGWVWGKRGASAMSLLVAPVSCLRGACRSPWFRSLPPTYLHRPPPSRSPLWKRFPILPLPPLRRRRLSTPPCTTRFLRETPSCATQSGSSALAD
jgi:PEGA domain